MSAAASLPRKLDSHFGFFYFFTGLWIRIHSLRIRIRIQSLMLEANTDPDPVPIRIQGFNDQKLKKNYSWKFFFIFFDQKLQFTYP